MGAVYRRCLLALALTPLDIALAPGWPDRAVIVLACYVLLFDAFRRMRHPVTEPAYWRRPTMAALVLVALCCIAFALSSNIAVPLLPFAMLALTIAVSADLRDASAPA